MLVKQVTWTEESSYDAVCYYPRATSTIFTAALIPHKTSLYNSRQRRDHVISACPTAQSREEKGIKASPSLIMKRNLRGRLIHAHNQKHLKRSNFSYHCDMMPKPSHAITIKKQWRNAIPSLRFQVEWNLIKRIHAHTGTLWPENTSFPHSGTCSSPLGATSVHSWAAAWVQWTYLLWHVLVISLWRLKCKA